MPTQFIPDDGLSETEARQRLARDSPNELPSSRPRGVLRLLRDVASEPMFLYPYINTLRTDRAGGWMTASPSRRQRSSSGTTLVRA